MHSAFMNNQPDISSTEEAKEYAMSLPPQGWPKIPQGGYWVTQYDALAMNFLLYRTIFELGEKECRVVECVFGLALQFDNGMARWIGKRAFSVENADHTGAFRLLAEMWRAHGLLPLSPETADYRDKLANAVKDLEEAFLESSDCVVRVAAQARLLLDTCPQLLSAPDRMLERRRYPRSITLKPEGMPDEVLGRPPGERFPWPEGF